MQKQGGFFQNCVFFGISIDRGCFLINRNWFKIFEWASVCFDRSNLRFWSIENCVGHFWKQFFRWVKHFFKKFSPFSLSIRLGQGKSSFFFVIFDLSFCEVFLSPCRQVHFTLPFAFYFMFSCINSCISLGFSELFKLGFLMIQTTFPEIDHWVLFL